MDKHYECTDSGNADRLLDTYENRLRYTPEGWILMTGDNICREVCEEEILGMAATSADFICDEADEAKHGAESEILRAWAGASGMLPRLQAAVKVAAGLSVIRQQRRKA